MTEWIGVDEVHPWWSVDTHWPENGIRKESVLGFTDKSVKLHVDSDSILLLHRFGATQYYPTWEEARQKCLQLLDAKIEDSKRKTQRLSARRQQINELKKNEQ